MKAERLEDHAMQNILSTLTYPEAQVLVHRIGLFKENAKTFVWIGLLFGVTSERIRQIYSKAIRKCRHPARRALLNKITHKAFLAEINKNGALSDEKSFQKGIEIMDESTYKFKNTSFEEIANTLVQGIIDAYKECPDAENKTFEQIAEWAGQHVLLTEQKEDDNL